jgi:hypothetical protein
MVLKEREAAGEEEATVIVRRTTDSFDFNADCQSDDSLRRMN